MFEDGQRDLVFPVSLYTVRYNVLYNVCLLDAHKVKTCITLPVLETSALAFLTLVNMCNEAELDEQAACNSKRLPPVTPLNYA